MRTFFLDSSALVKRYVDETGSEWMNQILAPDARHYACIAAITGVEVVAALTRRTRGKDLSAQDGKMAVERFRREFGTSLRVIALTPVFITNAMTLAERHALRGYDAVQLAVALAVQGEKLFSRATEFTFICADDELNAAAAREGMSVENPNAHP